MKQENHPLYTVMDAEYRIIDEEEDLDRAWQKGGLMIALGLAALGLTALFFPAAAAIAALPALWWAQRRSRTASMR